MRKIIQVFLILLILSLFLNCIQYSVFLNINENGVEIIEKIIMNKKIFSINDTIFKEEIDSDSIDIQENDSTVVFVKNLFIDKKNFESNGINYFETKNGYYFSLNPSSEIFIFNNEKLKSFLINEFTIKITVTNGKIVEHNANSVLGDTLFYTINDTEIDNEKSYPYVRVKTKMGFINYIVLFTFFVLISGLIIFLIFKEKSK